MHDKAPPFFSLSQRGSKATIAVRPWTGTL
jgi:hypothetical protein